MNNSTIGKFQLIGKLGSGGMAQVYEAIHPQLNRRIAIKVIHNFLAEDSTFLARFQREAQSVAALRHPHIVQVYDFDITPDNQSYMVMEFIDGRNLRDHLQILHDQGKHLPLDEAFTIVHQVGNALAYAHRQGMIHRDVKPANIMINQEGQAILTDFGLAKILAGSRHTDTGALVGTPAYMAPEQCQGELGDGRADLYALGIILYELVTGRPPFIAETLLGLITQQVNEPPPSPLTFNPTLPPWLEAIILKALAKNPADRYQSVEALLAALDQPQPSAVLPPPVPTPLAPTAPAAMQRKQATLLFSDIVDSTHMGQYLDPEDVVEIMNGALRRLAAVIEQHGGHVLRFMGDGLKAIFGAPVAREDDAERAVRAGLAILETAQAYALEVANRWRIDNFQVRVGINTGLVALGEGVEGANTAMGAAVNLAARMESAAPHGGLLISHHTFQHVRGIFDVQPLEPLQVKGVDEPVPVYRVMRAKPRAFRLGRRGVEGIATPMVGREAELRQLQEAFETAVDEGERQMITIRAEAGVGKSRLLDEFITWLELRPTSTYYFKGRARQEMQSQAYSLLRDLFASRFQIQESDRATEAQQKMEQGVAAALGTSEASRMKAHILGKLLGFDLDNSSYLAGVLQDSQELRDRALIYMADYFQALAAHFPVVILLEDIHWADDSSLDLLGRLALAVDRQRLLIVGAARPDLWQRRPHWGEGQPWHGRCDLRPLSKRDGRRQVTAILQKVSNLPESLRDLVADKAEGNPYYAEELVRMLIEDGIILTGGDTWRVELARLTDWRVPPTLTGILQARLDSLSPLERTELQRASVVGRIFWDDTVARLDESGVGRQTETLYTTFHTLRRREMIFQREPSAFAGTQEYIFKHALLREVTYESVLKRLRRVYHGLVAEWLMNRSGDRLEEYTGLIADHLEQAGRSAEAVPYLRRAGEQAQARFANAEAVVFLGRALALLPDTAVTERYELLLAREAIYNLLGQRDAQTADLDSLEKLAETLGDARRAEVLQRQAQYAEHMGDFVRARAQLEQSLTIAQTLNNQAMAADALYYLGVIASRQASYAEALEKLEHSLALVRTVTDPLVESKILRAMGVVAWYLGHYTESAAYYQQSLALARAIGHRRFESYCLGNLGLVASNIGDPDQARVYHEQSLAISRAIGDRAAQGRTLNNLGETACTVGEYAQGQAYLAESLRLARLVGNRPSENLALLNLARVALALAEYDTARTSFSQVLATAQAIGDRRQQGSARQGLGSTALEEGRLQDATGHFQEALQLWQELGLLRSLDARIGLARVALAQGEHKDALAWVEPALAALATQGEGDAFDPMRIHLTCYQVLQVNEDSRAPDILRQAHTLLQEQAARIPDEATRQSFLEKVLVHREILQAFAALSQEEADHTDFYR